jgi:osmotically-inducible protein OsmY
MRSEYSDAEIAQRVRTFLTSRHFPAFRALEVDVHNGLVSLRGHVRTFYEKQVALNSCRRVAGVLALDDQIKVDLDEKPYGPRRGEARPR